MAIELYSHVILLTHRFRAEGTPAGATGYVIEIYEDGALEVEFSNAEGTTIAQIVVQPNEIKKVEHQERSAEEIEQFNRELADLLNNTEIDISRFGPHRIT